MRGVWAFIVFAHFAFSLLASELPFDDRYGTIKQCDRRLQELGWIDEKGGNGLCGPTCIANVMLKFKRSLGLRMPRNEIDTVDHLARKFFPGIDFVHEGLTSARLVKGMKRAFKDLGVTVELRHKERFRLNELRRSLRSDEAVIVGIDWWHAKKFSFEDPDTEAVLGSHWAILAGIEGDDIILFDPLIEGAYIKGRVERFREGGHGRIRYAIRWENIHHPEEYKHSLVLLSDAVFIKVHFIK